MTSRFEERAGTTLSIVAALLWGTLWVATGYALQGFPPLAVAGWRGLGGVPDLAGVAQATVLGTRAGPFRVTQAVSGRPSPDGGAPVAGRIL